MAESTAPNLTQFTYLGRQFVKFAGIILVILIVGRMFLTAFTAFWQAVHPEPPPPPTVGFGILPELKFNEQSSANKASTYKLETATGSLPQFPDRAKVFFMPQSSLGLLADAQGRQIASKYDFIFEPQVLSSRVYRWTKSQPLESVLQLDLQTQNFKFTTDYLARPELLTNNQLPDNFEAVNQVKSMLQQVNLLAEDLATASGEVVYKKTAGGELVDALSFSDADYLAVNLNRTPIDGQYRMYSPAGYQGSIYALLVGSLSGNDAVLHLENNYHPVDYSLVHTYPLRSVQSAWKLVQNGEAYVADKGKSDEAVIRKVTLAYYDSFEEQEYLQPIYVFAGDDGFLAYVSAIEPAWVQK